MVFIAGSKDHYVVMDSDHTWALFKNGIHVELEDILGHLSTERHTQKPQSAMVVVKRGQEEMLHT